MAKNPASYALFKLGEFDEQTGEIKIFDTPTKVIGLWEVAKKPETANLQEVNT